MSTHVEFLLLESNSQRMRSAIASLSQLYAQYDRVLVLSDKRQQLEQIDEMLWHNSSVQFITYSLDTECYSSSTAVLLTDNQPLKVRYSTLLNIDGKVPTNPQQFKKIVELVSTDEHYKEQARENYKIYRQLGFAVTHKQLTQND